MGPSAYDVIVVVGGAIGLSAAYQCARAGKKVLLLVEQFEFFNEHASSKGDSRFFRIIYADARLSLLAQSAYALWRELEREAETTLLTRTGVLFYGIAGDLMTREGNLKSCLQVMDALGIPYQNYDASALKERFPVLKNIPPRPLASSRNRPASSTPTPPSGRSTAWRDNAAPSCAQASPWNKFAPIAPLASSK